MQKAKTHSLLHGLCAHSFRCKGRDILHCCIAGVFPATAHPIHWVIMTCLPPNAMSRQHCENMTSNGKQFTVNREMATAVACAEHAVEDGLMLSLESQPVFSKFAFFIKRLSAQWMKFCFPHVRGTVNFVSRESFSFHI